MNRQCSITFSPEQKAAVFLRGWTRKEAFVKAQGTGLSFPLRLPSVFVFLDSFPLTPNGKLDRTALPAPDISEQLTRGYVAPRNATEAILADIWAEVLGVEKVGIHDNFFGLGGHSLLVMQMASRIQAALQIKISLHTLFEEITIEALAETIEVVQWLGEQNKDDIGSNQSYEEFEL